MLWGGRSPETMKALFDLYDAMEADNRNPR